MFFVLFPAAKILLALPYLLFRAFRMRKKENFKQSIKMRVGLTAVVFIILEQPGIIGALCEYLTCTLIDPYIITQYVSAQAGVTCETDEYNSFKYTFVYPALAVWGFTIPIFLLLMLYKNKKNLTSSEQLRIVFGSLYNNYSSETYYWGIVIIIIFKISMYLLDSLLNVDESLKALLYLMLIHPYYFLFKRRRPHLFEDLQRAEKYVILCFIWTLSAVLVKDVYAPYELLSKLCDLTIAVANGVAIGYLLYKIFFVYLIKVLAAFSKVKAWWLNRKQKKEKTHKQEITELELNMRKYKT